MKTKLALLSAVSALALSVALVPGAYADDDAAAAFKASANANDTVQGNSGSTANEDSTVDNSRNYDIKKVSVTKIDDNDDINSHNKTFTKTDTDTNSNNKTLSVTKNDNDTKTVTVTKKDTDIDDSYNTKKITVTKTDIDTNSNNKTLTFTKTETEAKAEDGSLAAANGNATDNSKTNSGQIAGRDMDNDGLDLDVGDVLLNLASVNAALGLASIGGQDGYGHNLQPVKTGNIHNVSANDARGIAQFNVNSGIASQASGVSINAVLK